MVLTTLDEDASLAEALRAGVGGFLLQTAPPEQLLHAIRTVAGGNGLLHPAVTLRVMAAPGRGRGARPPRRRRPGHARPARGRGTAAGRRGAVRRRDRRPAVRGEAAVKTSLSRMLTELDLRDRVQAVAFAFRSGLVPLTPPG